MCAIYVRVVATLFAVSVAVPKRCETIAPPGLVGSLLQKHHSSSRAKSAASMHELTGFIDATFDDTEQTVTLEFIYHGQEMRYSLSSFSVFSRDAVLLKQTANGTQPLQRAKERTFRSGTPGQLATASITADGHVTGLFQIQGELVSVRPRLEIAGARASLADIGSGLGKIHVIEPSTYRPLLTKKSLLGPLGAQVVVDHYDPKLISTKAVKAAAADVSKTWNGTKWWPGCYVGDDQLHRVSIALIADFPFYETWGKDEARIWNMIADEWSKVSLIFEKQLHVRIEIGLLKLYTCGTPDCGPHWLRSCDQEPLEGSSASSFNWIRQVMGNDDPIVDKLIKASVEVHTIDQTASHAARMVLTSCRNADFTVGVAAKGGLCNRTHEVNYNVGVVSVSPEHGELVYKMKAHELGHLFGAGHSFEDGKSETGGIMDYGLGDEGWGEIEGEVQFNTKYRKAEMCNFLNDMQNSSSSTCLGKVQ